MMRYLAWWDSSRRLEANTDAAPVLSGSSGFRADVLLRLISAQKLPANPKSGTLDR